MASFKGEVIADGSGQWVTNDLSFATEAEAKAYVHNLMMRWMAVRDTRVVSSTVAPSHRWVGSSAELLPE